MPTPEPTRGDRTFGCIDQYTAPGCCVGNISISADIEEVADWAFLSCVGLESVWFPADSQVSRIGTQAFAHTGVRRVMLGSAVQSIGRCCMYDIVICVCVLCWHATRLVYSCFDFMHHVFLIAYDLGAGAFYDCTSMQRIEMMSTKLTSIAGAPYPSFGGTTCESSETEVWVSGDLDSSVYADKLGECTVVLRSEEPSAVPTYLPTEVPSAMPSGPTAGR